MVSSAASLMGPGRDNVGFKHTLHKTYTAAEPMPVEKPELQNQTSNSFQIEIEKHEV
jgi:hypothetical protein